MRYKFILGLFLVIFPLSIFAEEYWVDVRIPEEYQAEHLEKAVNIPLDRLRTEIGQTAKNSDDSIHLYCNSGRQSAMAKKMLKGMGYTNLADEGGIKKLRADHKTVTVLE